MTVRRVLIAWELGGHLGHLARLLPVATQLRQQGVSVLWVVRNLAAAARVLAGGDWQMVQAPAPLPNSARQRAAISHADILLLDGFADTENLLARLAAWHSLFKLFKPDAVLADYSPLAIYAAQTAGIHVVPIGHGFEIPPIAAPQLPSFQPWNPATDIARQQAEKDLQQAFEKLASTPAARQAPQTLQELYQVPHSALCIHPELDHFARPQAYFTGPLWSDLGELTGGKPPVLWPQRSGPKVLCYLHPQSSKLDLLFQQLTRNRCNVLLLSPQLAPQTAQAAAGWGLTVVTQTTPITPLVEQADAVITHGGMGLVGLALSQAKPLLMLPETAEQLILARQLVKGQLVRATTRIKSKTALAETIDALLSTEALTPSAQAYARRYLRCTVDHAAQGVLTLLTQPAQWPNIPESTRHPLDAANSTRSN